MKKKSKQLCDFIEDLHNYLILDPQFRTNVRNFKEVEIQREIRPLIISYLKQYFKNEGYKDFVHKANQSFYWEGQEGNYSADKNILFGTRNYPDFIILKPYLIAIEYKKNTSGSLIKHGIGQSIVHTLSGEFDYVYYLFHDENKDKHIKNSIIDKNGKVRKDTVEYKILKVLQDDFNVFFKII